MIKETIYVEYLSEQVTDKLRELNIQIVSVDFDTDELGIINGNLAVDIRGRAFEVGKARQFIDTLDL